MEPPRLQLEAIAKAFGPNQVLRGLSLSLAPGEIHALVGGNGAGKSTLSKVIAGLHAADAGTMQLDGAPYAPMSRRIAQDAGVVMVLQELNILPTLSVAENLFLDCLPARRGIVRRGELRQHAATALARVGLGEIDPDTPAGSLGVGKQQLVEIAAGLAKRCRVLILDEPTAALSGAETQTLFGVLRELRRAGTSIFYISHRLEELEALADRVSVLRDGQLIATLPARTTPREQLIELMAGVPLAREEFVGARANTGDCVLRVDELHAGDAVRGVSFAVHAGEIVGLGGLVGAGRTELLRAIFGADRRESGRVSLAGDEFNPRHTAAAVARGVAFVPEDRKHHGIFASLPIVRNASIAHLPRRGGLPGWIDAAAERSGVARLVERLQVRCTGIDQPIAQLSGGNQQKVVLARWLSRDVRLWLLDEPTRGVDAAARQGIYQLLRGFAAQGCAVLVASSDYEELAQLCDRVLVLSRGRITGEFTRATLAPAPFTRAAFAGFRTDAAAAS